jgi:hypothetical protein
MTRVDLKHSVCNINNREDNDAFSFLRINIFITT